LFGFQQEGRVSGKGRKESAIGFVNAANHLKSPVGRTHWNGRGRESTVFHCRAEEGQLNEKKKERSINESPLVGREGTVTSGHPGKEKEIHPRKKRLTLDGEKT